MLTVIKREIKKESQQALAKALKQSNMEYISHLCKYHSMMAVNIAQSPPIRSVCFELLTLDYIDSNQTVVADDDGGCIHLLYRLQHTWMEHQCGRV
jgi:hypothetical protein